MLIGLAGATPASAYELYAHCNTTGASGGVTVWDFYGATDRIDLSMSVDDMKSDSHHVSIRLLTKNHAGTVKYWSWHKNTSGNGTSKRWETYAKDDSGIFDVGIQVGRFEGSTMLNSCTDWS
ncbi:hypothetical protein [Streptomyces sp. NPDC056296]|uniref:hypothetical protein n=1 Tax=Streptomyces sp. NPDC056296 TaxID=3345775 RepID=UPI0035D9D4A3